MRRAPFVTALLVRNECDRYLQHVLDHHAQWGPLVILDDGSTDGTLALCQEHPATLVCEARGTEPAWGAEAPARARLWELAAAAADWILICDADQLLSADPRPLTRSPTATAWSFILYDGWNDLEHYRDDQRWRAHLFPRPWLFRPGALADVPAWNARGIHCGHAPVNFPHSGHVAPPDTYYWHHLGYVREADRLAKLTRYRSQYYQMSPDEQSHAESIADPHPVLRVLPGAKPIRILVGGPVRKDAAILAAHLQTLAWQERPLRVQLSFGFVEDYPDPADPGVGVLRSFVDEQGGFVLRSTEAVAGDFSDADPVTHQWTESAMSRVGRLKHRLMQECLTGEYDYLWLVDSDLLLDPTTLSSLLAIKRHVTSAVYWTRWNTDPRIHAGPQVWLKPCYELGLPHYPEAEFREALALKREVVRVGGLGACTLIHRTVIEKGVRFEKPPGFPSGGLWDGEDRHFCEWARRLHVDLHADAWPDIFHVYRPADAALIPAMLHELGASHPQTPQLGDLVNLTLTNIEQRVGPMVVRARIGAGDLVPDVEATVLGMQRGQTKIVRVHFPPGIPNMPQGLTQLVQVDLVDCKPFGIAPVVRDEFHVHAFGPVRDATTTSPEQAAMMAEDA